VFDFLLAPFREWRAAASVEGLLRVEARLQLAYLLRLPAWFIYRERKALGLYRFEDESFFYGETPWDVALDICRRTGLGADDTLYDLGCGRGKMVFAAHLATGCQAVGVDLLPTYIATARGIAERLGLRGARFEREDVLTIPIDDASLVYLNAFTFNDDLRGGLRARISVLGDGTWWVSVGAAWEHPRLRLEERRSYAFSWGRAEVWFYRVGPAGERAAPEAQGPTFDEILSRTMEEP
jgi:hypothetical protein